ncbi:NUDIX hydrolase [Candidatus Saccharibacteria bacterium]|nr:NUDIX hydrolase [Candidatus Saccharibacteria bacterium]
MSEVLKDQTGAKALIPHPGYKIPCYLFLERAQSSSNRVGRIDIPGGRRNDTDQSILGGLEREVDEETGLQIVTHGNLRPHQIYQQTIERRPQYPNVNRFTFLANVVEVRPVELSEEHERSFWLPRHEVLQEDLDDSLRELMESSTLSRVENYMQHLGLLQLVR